MSEQLPNGYSWECYEPSIGDWPAGILNGAGLLIVIAAWVIYFGSISRIQLFFLFILGIAFNVLVHEGIHDLFYKLRGYDSKIRVRLKVGITNLESPKINPYVVVPEQLMTNRDLAIGLILPLLILTPIYLIVILAPSNQVITLFLLFALAQNIGGSFSDVRDFRNCMKRESYIRIWMIETEEYASTYIGTPEAGD